MSERYSVITFDMGFTLVQLDPFANMFFRVGQQLGLSLSLPALDQAVDEVWAEVIKQDGEAVFDPTPEASRCWWREVNLKTLSAAGVEPAHWDTLDAGFMTLLNDPADYTLFPEVRTTLTALRDHGYRLGVISNWDANLPDLCSDWGIAPYFEFILASWGVGYAKPNPRIFQEALGRAGVDAGSILHVGDSYSADVLGAQSVGLDAVWLNRQGKAAPGACTSINSLDDLLPLLGILSPRAPHAG